MPTAIRIVNDTILPGAHDSYETGLTPREYQTRVAFFIIAFSAPMIGALFSLFAVKRRWTLESLWSFPRLCVLWFISVSAFAAIIFFQPGKATRCTFILAILHGMIEILMISYLLRGTLGQSLIASMIFGVVDLIAAFSLADLSYVFVVAAILGGGIDVLLPLLLLYGKQPLLALGAFAHTGAAIAVFTSVVHDYGVIPFTLISFSFVWAYVGFTVAGLLQASRKSDEHPTNLMKAPVSPRILIALTVVSLTSSTVTTVLLAYVAPKM